MNGIERRARLCALLALALCLTGCMREVAKTAQPEGLRWKDAADVKKPAVPEKLERDAEGVPTLKVYDTRAKKTVETDLERYVEGVVAGEMKNDWPMAALEAQAILARTFVLKFCQDKESKYKGADISTDVVEAQAYAADDVNARVRQAVQGTRGEVMSADGAYPYAWFHAHSGGMTELPSVALDYRDDDPAYLAPVRSEESEDAPEEAKRWTARFTLDEVAQACRDAGLKVDRVERIELGEKGASGRARTLLVNGQPVSAPSFRIQIGANRLRSTLIDSVRLRGDGVVFSGRGFGHGVGLSQWGAYKMAQDGADAEAIIAHYFRDVDIVKLW